MPARPVGSGSIYASGATVCLTAGQTYQLDRVGASRPDEGAWKAECGTFSGSRYTAPLAPPPNGTDFLTWTSPSGESWSQAVRLTAPDRDAGRGLLYVMESDTVPGVYGLFQTGWNLPLKFGKLDAILPESPQSAVFVQPGQSRLLLPPQAPKKAQWKTSLAFPTLPMQPFEVRVSDCGHPAKGTITMVNGPSLLPEAPAWSAGSPIRREAEASQAWVRRLPRTSGDEIAWDACPSLFQHVPGVYSKVGPGVCVAVCAQSCTASFQAAGGAYLLAGHSSRSCMLVVAPDAVDLGAAVLRSIRQSEVMVRPKTPLKESTDRAR